MSVLEFIFRALPHIFRAKLIQPPSKNAPYAYVRQFDLVLSCLLTVVAPTIFRPLDLASADRSKRSPFKPVHFVILSSHHALGLP